MGGFATGLIGEVGKQIQAHHERNVAIEQQAREEQARQYDRMAQDAEKAGNDALAADLHKGSFAIRTTLPGSKPKKITNPDGSVWDPMDMQGLIQRHTQLAAQQRMNQPPPQQPLAPNGVAPQPQGGMMQAPANTGTPQSLTYMNGQWYKNLDGFNGNGKPPQLTPPPSAAVGGGDNDPLGILK